MVAGDFPWTKQVDMRSGPMSIGKSSFTMMDDRLRKSFPPRFRASLQNVHWQKSNG